MKTFKQYNENRANDRFYKFINEKWSIYEDTEYYFKNIETNLKNDNNESYENIHLVIGIGTNEDRRKTITIVYVDYNSDNNNINLVGEDKKNYLKFLNNPDMYKKAVDYKI